MGSVKKSAVKDPDHGSETFSEVGSRSGSGINSSGSTTLPENAIFVLFLFFSVVAFHRMHYTAFQKISFKTVSDLNLKSYSISRTTDTFICDRICNTVSKDCLYPCRPRRHCFPYYMTRAAIFFGSGSHFPV